MVLVSGKSHLKIAELMRRNLPWVRTFLSCDRLWTALWGTRGGSLTGDGRPVPDTNPECWQIVWKVNQGILRWALRDEGGTVWECERQRPWTPLRKAWIFLLHQWCGCVEFRTWVWRTLCPLLMGSLWLWRRSQRSVLPQSDTGDRNTAPLGPQCCPGDQGRLWTEQPFVMEVSSAAHVHGHKASLGRKRLGHKTETQKLLQTIFMISTKSIPK